MSILPYEAKGFREVNENIEKSLEYYKEALDRNKKIGRNKGVSESLKNIENVYKEQNDKKNAKTNLGGNREFK